MSPRPSWILSALLLTAALAGEEPWTPPEQISDLQPGTRVRTGGKYAELVDRELHLVDSPLKFIIRAKEPLQKLLQFRAHEDNLVVSGVVVEVGGVRSVDVEEISLAPADAERFRREFEAVPAGSERPEKLMDLLGRLAAARARYGDPEVAALTREVAAECLRSKDAALDPGDYVGRIEWFRKVYELVRDRRLAFEFLSDLDRRFPDRSEVRAILGALQCRRYGGRWVTYDELKKLEGFVLLDGRWILPREKDFKDFVEALKALMVLNQPDLILRRRTEREYKLLAEKGIVEEGMKQEEVATALGFPERVERRVVDQKEVDQWSYGNRYYYFLGGLLVKKPAS